MINSKRKGKIGELEAAKVLERVLGVKARRGQQFKGGDQSPDLITSLGAIHWEVKRAKLRVAIQNAMEQAVRDAGESQIPVVLSRRDRGEWLLTVKLEDLKALIWEITQCDE